ncbi:hypothetical protein EDF46_3290 [Frondihabitans sp. PhB188]|uniref:hypothetical protein n=1 Tax=Frondihabitans sp. PhB188 TaxID=2485200 RepID=UPI000FA25866|nr:hypothetical protein [Frondihabitans sp. PhB188]ROQ36745.1 hypothetical protein EDF46_3290 [Frondihabitans sp. PhB188]
MTATTARPTGRVRLAVLAAGVAALASWTVATSAEWTDSLSLGPRGPDGGDLVSTSFGFEQRAVATDGTTGEWTGGGAADPLTALPFTGEVLEAGAPVYAALEVRTRAGSLAGRVAVAAPVPEGAAGPDSSALWKRLHVRIAALAPGAGCSAATIASGQQLADGTLASVPASGPVSLAADSGDAVLLCFEVGLDPGAQELPAAAQTTATWALQAVSTA